MGAAGARPRRTPTLASVGPPTNPDARAALLETIRRQRAGFVALGCPFNDAHVPAELRVTLWDGTSPAPREQLLATTGFHGGELTWIARDDS